MKKIVALVLCLVLALALCTTAFGATTLNGTFYAQSTADKLATGASAGTITYTAAKASETTNGVTTAGNIAYYTMNGKTYVEVNTLAEADVVVSTNQDMTKTANHYLFLVEVENTKVVPATTFTNFGKKCGQFTYADYDATKTYYLFEENGNKAIAVKVADSGTYGFVNVGGAAVEVSFVAMYDVVDHVAAAAVDKTTGKVTGYTCSNCGLAAIDAKNAASIPTGAQVIDGGWYFPTTAAAGTTTVESAKTFDAGIALYAGMALASVAGSAVVIGKKKEF